MHVRSIALTATGLMLAATAANAQRRSLALHPTFGIQGGANFAQLGGEGVANTSNRTGFNGGVYLGLPATSSLEVRLELLYSQEGTKSSSGTGTLKMDYLRLPVLFRYAFPTKSGARPFFAVGPSLGVQIKCNVEGSDGGVTASASCDDVVGDQNKKTFDLSGKVEGGVDFKSSQRTFSLGGAYSYGFTDTFDTGSAGAHPKNRVWSIFAAFGI